MCRGYPLRIKEPTYGNYHFEMAPECTSLVNLKKEYGSDVRVIFDPTAETSALLEYRDKMREFRFLKHRKHRRWVFNLINEEWEDYEEKIA